MKLEMITTLRILIIALLSYVPTCAVAGYAESFIAKKMGDSIPEEYGFLTLNPFVHFSFLGFSLMITGLLYGHYFWLFAGLPGFGKTVPLMPSLISGPSHKLKTFIECTGRSYAHLAMALFAAVCMMVFFDVAQLSSGAARIAAGADQVTSLTIALCTLLFFFFQQNVALFCIYFILGCFHTILNLYFTDIRGFSGSSFIILMLGLALFIVFFGHFLEYFVQILLYGLERILH